MNNFRLGQMVMTRRIADETAINRQFAKDVTEALRRYCNCDWGVTCEEDAELNNEALIDGERILAAYETCNGNIWIITEWDRSVTTILFPDEY